MADTKISGLAPVTDVQDSDEYPVARAGASKKITGANLKAAMPSAAADVSFAPTGLIDATDVQAALTDVSESAEYAVRGLLDAKGDLIAASGSTAAGTLPVGTNGQVLTADSAQTLGVGWADAAAARTVELKVIDDTTVLTTGDGKVIFCIPAVMNGWNLTAAHAFVTTASSSGLPTVQIRNVTDSVDMLTTKITIDASEFTSYTAATAAVVDTAHDDVATGDRIAVDVDVAGTGAKGLGVILSFELP